MNSIRRFEARPATLALSPTGSPAPKPRAVRRTIGRSWACSAASTACARRSLRPWFASAVPCESVCPPISKSAPGQPRNTSAIAAITPRLCGTMSAEPAPNWICPASRMAPICSAQISGRGRAALSAAAAASALNVTWTTAASPTFSASSSSTVCPTSS